jgi:hypothetical protein
MENKTKADEEVRFLQFWADIDGCQDRCHLN